MFKKRNDSDKRLREETNKLLELESREEKRRRVALQGRGKAFIFSKAALAYTREPTCLLDLSETKTKRINMKSSKISFAASLNRK